MREVNGDVAIIGSMLPVAAFQEFGTSTIPPRPFLGPAAFENREKIEGMLGETVMTAFLSGKATRERCAWMGL